MDQVVWVSGRTRRFGIVGDPITQVRSLQFVSAEFAKRGPAAILIPIPDAISVHALPSTIGRVDPRVVVLTGAPMLDGADIPAQGVDRWHVARSKHAGPCRWVVSAGPRGV